MQFYQIIASDFFTPMQLQAVTVALIRGDMCEVNNEMYGEGLLTKEQLSLQLANKRQMK